MHHLSSGESSKQQSSQKTRLLGELEDTKRSLTCKEEEIRQLVERMQRLEDTQERQARERRREPRRTTRHYMRYGSKKEEEEWRVQNYEARHHHQHQTKLFFSFVKLPSFSGESALIYT